MDISAGALNLVLGPFGVPGIFFIWRGASPRPHGHSPCGVDLPEIAVMRESGDIGQPPAFIDYCEAALNRTAPRGRAIITATRQT